MQFLLRAIVSFFFFSPRKTSYAPISFLASQNSTVWMDFAFEEICVVSNFSPLQTMVQLTPACKKKMDTSMCEIMF